MPPFVQQLLGLTAIAAYLAVWWFATWFATNRQDRIVAPMLGVLALGIGVPVMLVDLIESRGNPSWTATILSVWMGLPILYLVSLSLGAAHRARGRGRADARKLYRAELDLGTPSEESEGAEDLRDLFSDVA